MPYYIHKHEVGLAYGGSEEGGWWFNCGMPADDWNPKTHIYFNRGDATAQCRKLNEAEKIRAKNEEDYDITSVLAYRSTHYGYSVHETPIMEPYPKERPHYE